MTEQEDRDAILKELHQSDEDSGGSDGDLDLGIDKLKQAQADSASPQDSPEKKELDSKKEDKIDPLKDQEQRHKENLMQDLYENVSDEDEDDDDIKTDSKGDATDNPFHEQLVKEAQQMKQREEDEAKKESNQKLGEIKEAGAKVANAFKGFFTSAKEKVTEKVQNVKIDDYKQKVQQAGGGVGNLFKEAISKGDSLATQITLKQYGVEQRIGLEQFLKMDETKATQESDTSKTSTTNSNGQTHFVIDNEDEEGDGIDLNRGKDGSAANANQEEKKDSPEKVDTSEIDKIAVFNQSSSEDKTPQPGETYDGSSDEDNNDTKIQKTENKQESKPAEEEKKSEPEQRLLKDVLFKGNKLEIDAFEEMGITPVPTRKEVKNTSLVRNFISTFEDRFLCLVNLKGQAQKTAQTNQNSTHLVVLKKNLATGQQTKQKISAVAQLIINKTKDHIQNQMDEYKQTNQQVNVNPYLDPDVPQREESKISPYTNVAKALEQNSKGQEAEQTKNEDEAPNENPAEEEELIDSRPHWIVKSVIELERIFMIDIQQKGMFKVTLELQMHFVNESRNPGSLPKIKRYSFPVGVQEAQKQQQQQFLKVLERDAIQASEYYRKMKKRS